MIHHEPVVSYFPTDADDGCGVGILLPYDVRAQIRPISTQEYGNCRYDEIDESNFAGVGPCESLLCQYLGHIDADFTIDSASL